MCGLCAGAAFEGWNARADQVELVNGDRYVGKVTSLGPETLVLQSEFLGTVKIPRSRIATIGLGPVAGDRSTNSVRLPALLARTNGIPRTPQLASATNAPSSLDATLHQLNANSNVISQVQQQFLAGAGPEAEAKFNDLVSGLLSGRLGVKELRSEAKTTLDRARSARAELGDDGVSLDSYLSILEGFLQETEPVKDSATVPSSGTLGGAKAGKAAEAE
jgi:hypothetical protein